MKKFLLSMLTCCVCAGAWAQTQGTAGSVNVPTVKRSGITDPVNQVIVVKGGERQGVIKIQLTSSANCRDMQFDLRLPAGITLANAPTGAEVKMVEAKDANHVLFYALEGTSTVKIAVVDKVAALGADVKAGEVENATSYGQYLANDIVFELPIAVASDFNTDQATIANLVFTDDDATAKENLAVASTTSFDIVALLLGDVNDNGEVEIGDATCVINNVTNLPNEVYIEDVADMNGDEFTGDIGDATSIVNYVVGEVGTAKKYIFVEEDTLPDPE